MRNPLRSLFERRSIGSSHELYQALTRGSRSLAGVDVNESTAMQIAAVRACVDLIARDVASLPVDVIERVSERERRPAVTHPVRRLLTRPNTWQTWPEYLSQSIAHILLRGNSYSAIVRAAVSNGSEQITELLPMHPDQVTVDQAPYPSLAVTYRWQPSHGGQAVTYTQDQVLHLRGLSSNGLTGRAVIADSRETFGVAIATQNHASRFWTGGGVPRVVLRHPKVLVKGAANLEKSWSANYGGGSDQSMVAVLEEGMEIETLSVTAEDAQFLETRQFTRSEICGLFHVPPHMIADLEKSTSWGTGIEQQTIGYFRHALLPVLVNIEQRFARSMFVNPERFGLKFYAQGFMRGDAASRATYYWQMRQMGALSANDVRALEDLNGIGDDGDIYLQPSNLVPLGFAPAPATQGVPA
jgi:HK97 family phage portal protein